MSLDDGGDVQKHVAMENSNSMELDPIAVRTGMKPTTEGEIVEMIVIDEEAMMNSENEGCCSFSKRGKLTWWSAIIMALYVIGTLTSMIVIAVSSAHRLPPPISSNTHENSNVSRNSAFTSWLPSCEVVKRGEPFQCTTYVDCVMLSGSCVPSDLLETMQCQTVAMNTTTFRRMCVSVV
ncbi:uncharacterized protein TM35_000082820 [Trypanosoma theileri]|uniref:Uncharacterized protein n=1 Tax=Trypanosoma theileri TaxID=67003 RepID=A0A1X0P0L5_9TRYP|nr:uncharacterized protein TM35_000082820 [Trypanosoma theileri]ORC90484.1 hypothetical protein TM35_000082820 [Trypanosoma theileri]